MIKILKILNVVLNPKKIYLYLFLTLLVTLFEAFSISLIYPVLESVVNEKNDTSFNLPFNFEFKINTYKLIIILLSIYIIKNIYFIFYHWWQQKFIWNTMNEILFKIFFYFSSSSSTLTCFYLYFICYI